MICCLPVLNQYKAEEEVSCSVPPVTLELAHARIQKVLSEGVQLRQRFFFVLFFLVDVVREDPSTTLSGPSSACQQNAINWRFAGMPMMAQHCFCLI